MTEHGRQDLAVIRVEIPYPPLEPATTVDANKASHIGYSNCSPRAMLPLDPSRLAIEKRRPHDIGYSFGDDNALNGRLSRLLNEAVHVFRRHANGNWKQHYKPTYVALLAEHLPKNPGLIGKLLQPRDPGVSNITYAAVDLLKTEGKQDNERGLAPVLDDDPDG